jgi:hypothetical protein
VERCDECGFEYDLDDALGAGPAIVRDVAELVGILETDTDRLRTRREPETWSPLEYGCHVRDVLLVQRERVLAAQFMDRPSFNPMGRDERAELDGYVEQSTSDVVRQLSDAGLLFSNVLSRLDPSDWDRRVMYNYPKRLERSLRWVAVHTAHDVHHHVLDVRNQLD